MHMQNTCSHVPGLQISICKPIFKIFVAIFRTFGMQKNDMIIFVSESFRTR